MKRRAIIAALAIGMSFPVLAADQPPGNSQQLYLPSLGDIMVATQLRHFKLWHAGQVKNWALAKYELAQIKVSSDDATRLHLDIPAANMRTMARSADEVGGAIETKDSVKFARAFQRLTSECNSCHEAAGFGFIAIKEPRLSPIETSPFSDESFSPKQASSVFRRIRVFVIRRLACRWVVVDHSHSSAGRVRDPLASMGWTGALGDRQEVGGESLYGEGVRAMQTATRAQPVRGEAKL